MKFVVNGARFVPSDRVRVFIARDNNLYIHILRIGSFKIDRQRRKLVQCEYLFSYVGMQYPLLATCFYEDECLGIYSIADFGLVAIYNDHVCGLNEIPVTDSKIIYNGKKVCGNEIIEFTTRDTVVSQDGMYEVIPSLIVNEYWMVKTMDHEMKMGPKLCKYLFKGNYPALYVDDFIKLVNRYRDMEQKQWLFEKWAKLKYNLEKLLHDEEVLGGLLM